MTALGLTDTNRIRNAERVKCEPVLNTVPLIEIASATIASVPAYPGVVASVGVTGVTNWANVGVGRAFSIESAAGKIKSWGVVRLFPTSTTFYMDAKSDGDGGYARDTMEPFVAGDVIRVYWHRPDWALISRATGEAAFKAWDIAYDGSNSLPVPVCNIIYEPQHWAVAGKARVRLDASLSFDWLYSFAGIIAYQWSLPVGSTIVTGSASSAIVEADIPSGTHEIVCTVTSQTGRQSTGFRWLFINERDPASPHAPFNYKYAIESIRGDTSSRDGREMTFVPRGDVRADLYPGQPFVFTNRVYYDGQLLTDTTNRHFIGFLDEMGGDFSRRDKTTTFKVQGGLKITKALPSATQLMEETLAPNDWTQVAPSFMHSAFAAYYILRHHTTSLYNHNFGFNLNLLPLRRRNFGFSQETIGAQLGFIEDISLAEINATSDGFIYMLREPSHLVNQARDALPIRYTIKGTDLRDRISLEPRLRPQAAFVVMDGLAYNGQDIATYRAVAPGYAQGQGLSKSDDPDITVTVGGGQAELEFVVGDRFAYNNNPLDGLSLKLLGMIDIFDPALDDWLKLDIDEDYLQFRPDKFGVNWRGRDGTGIRARPVQVTRNWRKVGNVWVFDVNLTIRTETDGTRGAFLPVERGGAANYVTPPGVIETPPLL
ncbi:MAG: hypothetical protein SF029_24625, partial [bacterium]|nr:hypothetical protein [bacterium]